MCQLYVIKRNWIVEENLSSEESPKEKSIDKCRYEIHEQKEVPVWYTGPFRALSSSSCSCSSSDGGSSSDDSSSNSSTITPNLISISMSYLWCPGFESKSQAGYSEDSSGFI
jgi:hypothetical protein